MDKKLKTPQPKVNALFRLHIRNGFCRPGFPGSDPSTQTATPRISAARFAVLWASPDVAPILGISPA